MSSVRTLDEELDGAARALRALETESNSLPARLETAARAGDLTRLHELRARRDALPVEVDAARVNFLRLRVEAEEASHSRARRELATAEDEMAVLLEFARQKWDELQEAAKRGGEQRVTVNILRNRVEVARRTINELRSQLSAAVRQAATGEESAPTQYGLGTGREVIKGAR